MKKEDLVKLGLNDEQIAEIFKMNGQDIEKLKTDNTVLTTEKANLETQLNAANKAIDDFKNINVDDIRQEAEQYKTQYTELKAKHEEEINDLKSNHAIDSALLKSKAKNAKAVKALLDLEQLKSSKNFEKDLETQINGLIESDSYLFDSISDNVEGATGGVGDVVPPQENMTYSQMLEFLEKNPNAKI